MKNCTYSAMMELNSPTIAKLLKEARREDYNRLWEFIPSDYEHAITREELAVRANVSLAMVDKMIARGNRYGRAMCFDSDYLPNNGYGFKLYTKIKYTCSKRTRVTLTLDEDGNEIRRHEREYETNRVKHVYIWKEKRLDKEVHL